MQHSGPFWLVPLTVNMFNWIIYTSWDLFDTFFVQINLKSSASFVVFFDPFVDTDDFCNMIFCWWKSIGAEFWSKQQGTNHHSEKKIKIFFNLIKEKF